MSYEVEMKFRVEDHAELLSRLLAEGAVPAPTDEQEDVYLKHPARDFAQTNEALRLRRVGNANAITYKGPRLSGPTKTREEIEISFADGQEASRQLLRLFENLGFDPVAAVRKRRHPFRLTVEGRPVEVVLDEVEGLGTFAEVETIARTDAELAEAQATVLAVAARLGLSGVEPRSYLRMQLEREGLTGR